MKNPFKKKKFPTPQAPRQLEDIQKSYQDLLAKAAQAQYLVFVHSEDLKNLNLQLVEVNKEAAARQQLDREAKNSNTAVEETKAVNEMNKREQNV